MKTVLVTGASGLLGSHVVGHLLNKGYVVYSAIMPVEETTYVCRAGEVVVLNNDVFEGRLPHVDVVINCAFARSNNPEHLASAFDFTTLLLSGLRKADVDGIINISSQGVYKRLPAGQLSTEDSPIEPIDIYSMSKYATEKMCQLSGIKYVTSIRLASLNMKQRFLYTFVKSAIDEGKIYLNSPKVCASILDVEDAAEALTCLVERPQDQWQPVYNLSIGVQYSLEEYAKMVQKVGAELGYEIDIVVNDNGNNATAGVDINRFVADCGWKPRINTEMIINTFFQEEQNARK